MFYDINSKGAESYIQLAKEVIANAQKRLGQGSQRADSGAGAGESAASAAAGAGSGSSTSSSNVQPTTDGHDGSGNSGGTGT
jgi:hypothetical protein